MTAFASRVLQRAPTAADNPICALPRPFMRLKQRGVLAVNSIIYIVGLVVVVVAVLSFFGLR
ncbi:hypothetical protein RCH10_004228 [Variovorax sp. GrIS 2.14]|uniref:hypothetical protein n=1 Tax=Variovorax sp. GrIS 2.14 TaxID=3071709 RepID=UPI0019859887|nr:hypothetical protein [Variovorax sp.]